MLYPIASPFGSQMLIQDNVISFPKASDTGVISPLAGEIKINSRGAGSTADISLATEVAGKVVLQVLSNLLADTLLVKDGAQVKEGQPLGKTSPNPIGGAVSLEWKAAIVLPDNSTVKLTPLELGGLLGGLFFGDQSEQALNAEAAAKQGFFEGVGKTVVTFGAGVLAGAFGALALSK